MFSSPEPKAGVRPFVRAPVCPSVNTSKRQYLRDQRVDRNQILPEALFGWGNAGPDQTRTLVSMATDSFHRSIMGENGVATFSPLFYIRSFSYLQVTMAYIRARRSVKFGTI